jgi:hypothetical protein
VWIVAENKKCRVYTLLTYISLRHASLSSTALCDALSRETTRRGIPRSQTAPGKISRWDIL